MNKTDSFGNALPKTMYVSDPSQLGKALAVNTFRLTTDQAMYLGHTVKYDADAKTAAITDKDTGLTLYARHP
jgi:hypothetical protein